MMALERPSDDLAAESEACHAPRSPTVTSSDAQIPAGKQNGGDEHGQDERELDPKHPAQRFPTCRFDRRVEPGGDDPEEDGPAVVRARLHVDGNPGLSWIGPVPRCATIAV